MMFVVLAPMLVVHLALPSNVEAGMLQPVFIELLEQSETFREQCARIAATPVLRVRLHVGMALEDGARAQTVINRHEAGGIRAEVTLRFSEDYLELLAHEFEHILEQVDGVVLSDEVAAGRAWRTPNGAFETLRAFNAGVRARNETLAAEAVHMDSRKVPGFRH
jgi:hypothetical protein